MPGSRLESPRDAFWNDRTRRPRAVWRLLGLLAVLLALGLLVGALVFTLAAPVESLVVGVIPDAETILLAGTAATILLQVAFVTAAVYVATRLFDRRGLRDLGLRVDADWWLDLVFGLALGAALMAGIFLVEVALGWVTVTGTFRTGGAASSFWPWFALTVGFWLAVGFYEELLTRGYLLTNLAEGFTWFERLGSTAAVGLATGASSLVFAVLHAANPNASLASTAGIFLAGLMLAAGYVLTGELAIPIGLHVTWNLFQGSIFGFPVSGMGFGVSLVAIDQAGPTWLTGGSFGPEAGLLGIAGSVAGLLLIAVWVWRRKGEIAIAPSITEPALRTDSDTGSASGAETEPQ